MFFETLRTPRLILLDAVAMMVERNSLRAISRIKHCKVDAVLYWVGLDGQQGAEHRDEIKQGRTTAAQRATSLRRLFISQKLGTTVIQKLRGNYFKRKLFYAYSSSSSTEQNTLLVSRPRARESYRGAGGLCTHPNSVPERM